MDAFLFCRTLHTYVWGTEQHYLPPEGAGVTSEDLPLLIKRIAADTALSVQVHPSDECAARHGFPRGKTEAWLTDECKPDACLFLGLRENETPSTLARAVESQTLPAHLNCMPVHKDELYFVPAGRIHAIGGGVSLYEVQQNIALTYRLYDYGRLDKNGQPRELHVARALEAASLFASKPGPLAPGNAQACEGYTLRTRMRCSYFCIDELDVSGTATLTRGDAPFTALLLTKGDAVLQANGVTLTLSQGACAYLPPACAAFTLSGSCVCLQIAG